MPEYSQRPDSRRENFSELSRQVLRLSWPVFLAQIAYIAVAAADTMMVGHYATPDLAAISIGGGLYVMVFFSLMGVLQAVSPVVAQHFGAGRHDEIARDAEQGFWLALLMGIACFFVLRYPQGLLALTGAEAEVQEKAARYLEWTALGVPFFMLFRAFYALSAAISRPLPVMLIAFGGAAINIPLDYAFIHGVWGFPEMGGPGCGAAKVFVGVFQVGAAAAFVLFDRHYRELRILREWRGVDFARQRKLVRLGLPIAFSIAAETSAYALMAWLAAPLGAVAVGGHQVIANLTAVFYMPQNGLATGCSVLVGQAVGARDFERARRMAAVALAWSMILAVPVVALLLTAPEAIAALYTGDAAVMAVVLALAPWLAFYHFFDAAHVVISLALRGYHRTVVPMIAQGIGFWPLGLGGGWWLAYGAPQMGVAGFWAGGAVGLVFAALTLGAYLRLVGRSAE